MKKSKIIVFIVVMTILLATLSACSTTKASFKINFEVDGAQYDSVEMSGKDAISLPADPTKKDCIFDGWYLDKDVWEKPLTMDSFLNEKLTSNMTVYARWVTIDECFAFVFTDETQSAYMITRKEKATVPSKLVLPSEYKGKPVIAVEGLVFRNYGKVTSITIPASVQYIDIMALYCGEITDNGKIGISNLTNIIVDNANANYKSIEGNLYSKDGEKLIQCANGKFTIPASVTSVEPWAFLGCGNLTNIMIEKDNAKYQSIDGNLYSKDGKTIIKYAAGNTATKFAIPAGVTAIGANAFFCCSNLTDITIPASVSDIEAGAFYDCSSLTSITIPSGVTRLGFCFRYCSSLTSVTIPASVTNIADGTFDGCSSLTSVTFEAGSKLESIGEGAFDGCSSLTSITIPASVETIYYSFIDCKSLTSVTFEAGSKLERIGGGAFSGCSSLTSITIPASVTEIVYFAFSGCSSLTNITVESGNTKYKSIDGNLYSKDGSTLIQYAIGKTATSFAIPAGVTSIGNDAFEGCSSLTNITVESGNTKYKSIDGNLYSKDGSTLIQYAIGKTATSFTIPAGVTSIGDGAFRGCSSLISITIPAGVTSIGYDAFAYCSSLTSVAIPASVTIIDSFAFRGCSSLTSVTIPASVTYISDRAFYGCSSLTSVTIPAGVTSIGEWAFEGCSSLTSVTIPAGVTSIGEWAFEGCSKLTIYAEAASKPAGWSSDWNSGDRPVVWGHKN